METLKNYTFKAKDTLKKWLVNAGLAWILMFWAGSCEKTTTLEDVLVEKRNIEIIKGQIRSYRDSRKDFVDKYNNLCTQPQGESNAYQIEITKAKYYKEVLKCEKKIKELVDERIGAEERMAEKSAECVFGTDTGLLDPYKYDYLLDPNYRYSE